MRELILKMSVSLDGFVARPDGEIDWVFGNDAEAVAWSVERVSNASLHIMGSVVFQDMAAYWPTSTAVFAPPMNVIPKAVFSKQGPAVLHAAAAQAVDTQTAQRQPGADSWAEAHVVGGDLAHAIARLKDEDGKPIVAHGGAAFARSLIAANLVDEYALLVHPIALGRGMPIFSDLPEPLRLVRVESRAFSGGSTAQVYRPA